jgi:hypothetical protein
LQGLLDDQFLELQQLQDESSPDFVEEVVLLFIQDSGRIIKNLTESLYVFLPHNRLQRSKRETQRQRQRQTKNRQKDIGRILLIP